MIEVTQKHIDEGERCHGSRCPLALAIADKVSAAFEVNVNYHGIRIVYLNKTPDTYNITKAIIEFLAKFDVKKPVKPTNFRLTLHD